MLVRFFQWNTKVILFINLECSKQVIWNIGIFFIGIFILEDGFSSQNMTLYLPFETLYLTTWHYILKYDFIMRNTYFLVPKNTAVSHDHILLYQPLTCVLKRRSIWCGNTPSEALSWNYQTLHDPCMQTVSRLKATVYPGLSFSVGVLRNIGPLMRK